MSRKESPTKDFHGFSSTKKSKKTTKYSNILKNKKKNKKKKKKKKKTLPEEILFPIYSRNKNKQISE